MGKHVVGKLTARFVASPNLPYGKYRDGGGLILVNEKSGRRWVYKYTIRGKTTELGLGPLRDVPLVDARRKAGDNRSLIANGLDPKAEKFRASGSATTFGPFAIAMWEEWKKEYRNEKHIWQWRHTVETHCKPIWDRPIDKVTRDDILAVLKPVWDANLETASRLRQRIERVLDAAKARGLREGDNPAGWKGGLKDLLPKPKKLQKKHYPAMPYRDVPAFVASLRQREGFSALALEFIILTAARSQEVREMTWAEVDFRARVWTLAPERMKAGKQHQVPLSDRAIAILEEAKAIQCSDLVFPSLGPGKGPAGEKDRPFSSMVFKLLMKRMGVKGITTHGFRSSFRDWAGNETNAPREVAEECLAHAIGSEVERSYRRETAMAKRRVLLSEWADFQTQ
jgi:integrase